MPHSDSGAYVGALLVASRLDVGRIVQLEDWLRRCAAAAVQGALEAAKLRKEFGADALTDLLHIELAAGGAPRDDEGGVDSADAPSASVVDVDEEEDEGSLAAPDEGAEGGDGGAVAAASSPSPSPKKPQSVKDKLLLDIADGGPKAVDTEEAYLPPDLPPPPPRAVCVRAAADWSRSAIVATPKLAQAVSAVASVATADDPLVAWRDPFNAAVALASLDGR